MGRAEKPVELGKLAEDDDCRTRFSQKAGAYNRRCLPHRAMQSCCPEILGRMVCGMSSMPSSDADGYRTGAVWACALTLSLCFSWWLQWRILLLWDSPVLCPLSMWRADSGRAVASSGSTDEQRHAEEQHRDPLYRRAARQHCEGKHSAPGNTALLKPAPERKWRGMCASADRCMCVLAYVHVYVCGGQLLTLGVFLCCSPLCFQDGVPLNLELTGWLGWLVPASVSLPPPPLRCCSLMQATMPGFPLGAYAVGRDGDVSRISHSSIQEHWEGGVKNSFLNEVNIGLSWTFLNLKFKIHQNLKLPECQYHSQKVCVGGDFKVFWILHFLSSKVCIDMPKSGKSV